MVYQRLVEYPKLVPIFMHPVHAYHVLNTVHRGARDCDGTGVSLVIRGEPRAVLVPVPVDYDADYSEI